MASGFPWSKDFHDQNLSKIMEAALSPAAIGILYLCRCKAGQERRQGKFSLDGALATRPSLLAWLKRQYGEGVTEPLGELFERGFLQLARKHVVVIPWKEDQTETPAARRMRERRERERMQQEMQNRDTKPVGRLRSDDIAMQNHPENIGYSERNSSRTVTCREEKSENREKRDIKTDLGNVRGGGCAVDNVIPFSPSSETGRGSAPPPSGPPCSGSEARRSETEENRIRGEERREEESSVRLGEARRGGPDGGGADDWRSINVYQDPFLAAQVVAGEWTKDFSATCKNAMQDLGREMFAQAVSELRQERAGGKVRNPAAMFNVILNRYRDDAGLPSRHSRRIGGC